MLSIDCVTKFHSPIGKVPFERDKRDISNSQALNFCGQHDFVTAEDHLERDREKKDRKEVLMCDIAKIF